MSSSGLYRARRGRSILVSGVVAAGVLVGAYLLLMRGTPLERAGTSAKSILSYFCIEWTKGDYDAMYAALSPARREEVSLTDWRAALEEEGGDMGLPKSFKITGPEQDLGSKSLWSVTLSFSNTRVGELKKQNWASRGRDGWRVDTGGLGPFKQKWFAP